MRKDKPIRKKYSAGEVIFRRGDISDDIYFVHAGIAEAIKLDDLGNEVVVAIFQKNEIFGELGIILQKPRIATVRARTNLKVDIINPRSFSKLYDFEIGQQLKPVIQAMAERLRNSEIKLAKFKSEKSQEKIGGIDFSSELKVKIVANTKIAMASLGNLKSVEFTKFPMKFGRYSRRRSDNLFHLNDFHLYDQKPYNISRSHFSLEKKDKQCIYLDRESRLGSIVNDEKIGGDEFNRKTIELHQGKNSLIIGMPKSGFSFSLIVTEE